MSERYFQSGRFRVLAEIGRGAGGRCEVYRAVCEKDGFEGVPAGAAVALKVVEIADDEHGERLRSRARVLMKLVHPGAERCYGYFAEAPDRSPRRGVFVCEWLEGETLKERLRKEQNGLDADESLRIGENLLSTLVYASSQGVVHRNVEPGSVFLCADGEVKLVDFLWSPSGDGLAVDYAAPEFCHASPDFQGDRFAGDEQSDLFSLGVCLHEMLTGRLPRLPGDGRAAVGGKPLESIARRRRVNEGDDPVQVRSLISRLLVGANEVLEMALRPKRSERYATFADFAAAFKGIRCRELKHGDDAWRLLRFVGRGFFCEVFKARDVKTGAVVAVKHLLNGAYADRFRREARVLSRLQAPGIVRFISFFEEENGGCRRAFLVMEYLDGMPGQSLGAALKRAGGTPLPRTLVLRAFARYAHGLSAMHARGLVHRCIEPGGLYFPMAAIDRASITSSIVVRDVNGSVTDGMAPCVLGYAPPEIVVSGARGDAGMDVYALGLSLYEALSGKTAYPRLPMGMDGVRELLVRVRNKTRPALDESSYSDLPDLVRLVRAMTEPEAAGRLKDAAEVERRLLALCACGKRIGKDGEMV